MSTEERLHERRQERIAAGREAYAELQKHEHFRQWLAIADALVAIREQAMEAAHTNRPQGPPYRRAFAAIIEQQETWATGISDSARAHCYWLVDTLPAVQRWRETLTFEQRDQWNHPTTIKRQFERITKVRENKEKGAPPARNAASKIIELQDEVDKLRAQRDGEGLLAGISAEEAAEKICEEYQHNPRYVRRLINALIKWAEANERQDTIEAKRGKARKPALETAARA